MIVAESLWLFLSWRTSAMTYSLIQEKDTARTKSPDASETWFIFGSASSPNNGIHALDGKREALIYDWKHGAR
jgi:hypothetical protein